MRHGRIRTTPAPSVTSGTSPSRDYTGGITQNITFLVCTQTNANTRNPGNQCVQWRITPVDSLGLSRLERRSWSVNWQNDGIVSDWRDIADNVVNRQPPEGGGAVSV